MPAEASGSAVAAPAATMGRRDSPFYDVAGSLLSVPARQHVGVVMHRLPAAPWGEQRGAASTGGSHTGAHERRAGVLWRSSLDP